MEDGRRSSLKLNCRTQSFRKSSSSVTISRGFGVKLVHPRSSRKKTIDDRSVFLLEILALRYPQPGARAETDSRYISAARLPRRCGKSNCRLGLECELIFNRSHDEYSRDTGRPAREILNFRVAMPTFKCRSTCAADENETVFTFRSCLIKYRAHISRGTPRVVTRIIMCRGRRDERSRLKRTKKKIYEEKKLSRFIN